MFRSFPHSLFTAVVSLCVLTSCLPLTTGAQKDIGRVARSRYKMGYMFGKRSDVETKIPEALRLHSIFGKSASVEDLSRDLQTDSELALQVARHLDRDGDGYVSVRELL